MKYAIGDKVLCLKEPLDVSQTPIKWPIKGVIRSLPRPFTNIYKVRFETDNLELRSSLMDAGLISMLGQSFDWAYSENRLMKDNVCMVCNNTIETYGIRRLIQEHQFNGVICYGSHVPLDF